ncbi:zinc finger protein 518B-like [Myxocyprinus asiaticus]|uniref:zinc finger protein 518B-like n=1 Tax=Myxocyprinus asiaticus TaxID=70543 RepID=UPI002222C39F|nr:zinc finger protein 518B-like [Myxocyprinus asiaticus]
MRSQQSFMSFMNNKDKGLPKKDNDRLCCTKCRFSTKDIDVFGRHVAHHEEVTFSCALCSHVSYSKTESQKHVVTHTGSYPYRCSFCSYGAVRRDYMVKHIHRVHKSRAEGGFLTDFSLSDPTCESPSVPDTHRRSVWPERNEQCVIPNTAGQLKANSHVEYPSGSQPRGKTTSVIGKTVGQTSSKQACMTSSTSVQCVTNTTPFIPVAKSQFTGSVPSISHLVSNSLQVVLRSREENGNLSNAVLSGNGQSTKTVAEKPIQKAAFPRIHTGDTEVVLQSQRVVVPEKVIQSKVVPRVKVRLPAEVNTPLRPLLNTPMRALSQRNVPVQNVQTDQKASQSTTGTNVLTVQKVSLAAGLPNGPIKPSERGPLPTIQKAQTTENSNQPKLGSSAEKSSHISNVQVELLAPLNQPIQHNKPLTVSCPEEINIPAGCLVELVEVKNVNGTRELELRMIPPNGLPQDLRSTVNGPSPVATTGKLSFKCQVAASKGCTDSPSKSLTSHKAKQQPPLACTAVQSATKTVHPLYKPQCSSGTVAQSLNKQNLKLNGTVFKPSLQPARHDVVTLEGTELSSEGLPVISSVYSLCPTPASTHSISQSMPEHLSRTLQTNRPVIKLQGEFKVLSDPECVLIGAKNSKDYVKTSEQSVVCSFMIKKEDKTEEKCKVDVLGLKETKTEHECTEETVTFQTCSEEKLVLGKAGVTFGKCSNLNTGDLKETPNVLQGSPKIMSPLTVAQPSVMPRQSKDNISDQDKVHFESRSDFDGQQRSSHSSLMYPKVALVRIPSSQLETIKNPEVQTQEQSLTARPVLCCMLSEKNVSSGPEGAIKLIIKRDLPGSEKKNQDHDGPPRKKHKKGKWKTIKCMSSSVVMGCHNFLTKGQELRLTPLKEDQLVKLPGPNQPVVVLNHPNPSVQMASVGVQTLKNFKWISSAPQTQEQTGEPASKQPSFKMKLKKVKGQKYQVIEFVLRGVTEKLLM